MKRNILHELMVVLGLCLLPSFGLAHSIGDKVNGYVVLDNGKKIDGFIIIGSLLDNEIQVQFVPEKSSIKKLYEPKDLKSYAYITTEIDDSGDKVETWIEYKRQRVEKPPKPLGSTLVFMQLVEKGKINLFTYFSESSNAQQLYTYSYYIEQEDGLFQEIRDDSFERTARMLFKDYTALVSKIGKDDFLFRNVDQIVRDFNFWMVNHHDRNEYKMALKMDYSEDERSHDEMMAN